MKKTLTNSVFFLLLALVFFMAVLLNNKLLKGINIDLTEQQVYSLSSGSEAIIAEIEEPINLYFFFSDSNSTGMTGIRDYAARVESLLTEYARKSKGKISLEVIDPEPFSESEDRASSFGLTAAPTGVGSDTVYFGLAGTNSLDDGMIIGFFDPQKEAFLEYDISKLVYQLSEPEPINLTILSDLALAGGQNPMTGQGSQPYVLYQQLKNFFDVTLISSSDEALPEDTDVLMAIHPQNIAAPLTRSIDQFLMQGGKALMFIDPHFESDPMTQMGSVGANSSEFELLTHYGISINTNAVVLDAQSGLEVRASDGSVIRHLGILGLGADAISRDDITSADLESINGASFGYIELTDNSKLTISTMLSSTSNTAIMSSNDYATATSDPASLAKSFVNEQFERILAARVMGPATSILTTSDHSEDTGFGIMSTENLNLVLVADADIIADRFWVQQSNFFGQMVVTPFANNGDLIINILENLGGSEGLIGIRSRGTFSRPFTHVQDIRVVAEAKFREQEQLLQARLEETEAQLTQLQTQSDNLTLSAQQQQAIDEFTQQKLSIRKSLRDVQFQLNKDIDALGNVLKLLNIAVAPIVIVLFLFAVARITRKRAKTHVQ